MPTTLEGLLKKERSLHARLDSWLASTTMDNTDIEALGLQYEACLLNVLDYTAKNPTEVTQKFEFVFDVIKREYEDHRLLTLMQTSLSKDLKSLNLNPGFG